MKRTSLVLGILLCLCFAAVAQSVPTWQPNTFYATGALVTYNTAEYKCLQAHTSQVGWEPPNVPALWQLVSGVQVTPTPTPVKTDTPMPPPATPTVTPLPGQCTPSEPNWSATQAYIAGMKVVYKNVLYLAAYWSQGANPATNNGPTGSGEPWIVLYSCSATPTPTPICACGTPTPTPIPPPPGTKMFAPYVDISLASGEQVVSNASAAGLRSVTLAFLVDGGCVANWGGLGGSVANATFPNGTTVASQINQLISNGVAVIISWGGANGSIASSCSSASSIQAMYHSVFNAYPGIAGQDFDIEGGINATAVAQALAGLKSANPNKSISLTLPVLPTGLVSAGLSIVNACHSAGFHPDTINVMAMDYGSGVDGLSSGATMGGDAENAGSSTHSQTGDNVGITPMIGVNDTSTEVFQLSDASNLVSWANGQSYVNRLAFWSLGRDNDGCPNQSYASATCSGVSQSNFQYSSVFRGF